MAIKSTLFLLAFVLFMTTRMASSMEAREAIENEHHHSKAPAHAPAKAPAHPPMKAPWHPPVFHHTNVCVEKCETHCKDTRPRKRCMKTCTACCTKFKCVPDGSNQYCKNWDGVVIRGKIVKCP